MEWITIQNLSDLDVGDVIMSKATGERYVVTSNYGTHVTAVKSVDVTNPPEWMKLVRY